MAGGRGWRWAAQLGLVGVAIVALDGRPRAQDAAGAAGMQAHVDPATGQFVPEPVVPPPPVAALPETPLVVEHLPSGVLKIALHGRFQSALVETIQPDGSTR